MTNQALPPGTHVVDTVTGLEGTRWELGGWEQAVAFVDEHFPTAYLHGKVPGHWRVPGEGVIHYGVGRVTFIREADRG